MISLYLVTDQSQAVHAVLAPVHWILAAQALEIGVPDVVLEEFGVADIEFGQRDCVGIRGGVEMYGRVHSGQSLGRVCCVARPTIRIQRTVPRLRGLAGPHDDPLSATFDRTDPFGPPVVA